MRFKPNGDEPLVTYEFERFNKSGERVYRFLGRSELYVSVTTIAGRHNTGVEGLLRWAGNLAAETGHPTAFADRRREAGDRGTRLHLRAAELVADPQAPEPLEAAEESLAKAIVAAINRIGKVEAIEITGRNDDLLYAGTVDYIITPTNPEIYGEKQVVVDLKTGKTISGSNCHQIAAYSRFNWFAGEKTYDLNHEIGVIVHANQEASLRVFKAIIPPAWENFTHLCNLTKPSTRWLKAVVKV